MYIIEIFRKRKVFEPLFKRVWDRISGEMSYPPMAGQEPEQKLIYFGLMTYAAVFETAVRVGMSTSGAHYLSRIQLKKYRFDAPITAAVESFFSGGDEIEGEGGADFYLQQMAGVIEEIERGDSDIRSAMLEMSEKFRRINF